MKWFDRALSSFLAGILFLLALQLLYATFSGVVEERSIGIIGVVILGVAIILFFVGYKGRTTL